MHRHTLSIPGIVNKPDIPHGLGSVPGFGSRQPHHHTPGLPTRSRNGAAVTPLLLVSPTVGEVRPLVGKIAKDLGITVDSARVMVADAERRARDREAEWARRRYRSPLEDRPEILEAE